MISLTSVETVDHWFVQFFNSLNYISFSMFIQNCIISLRKYCQSVVHHVFVFCDLIFQIISYMINHLVPVIVRKTKAYTHTHEIVLSWHVASSRLAMANLGKLIATLSLVNLVHISKNKTCIFASPVYCCAKRVPCYWFILPGV